MNRRMFFGSMPTLAGALTLKPEVEPFREGDVLVIECDDYLAQPAIANLTAHVKDLLPPGVKVLVLDCGLKVKLLRPETVQTLLKD
jgi:hypothetical protein